MLGDGFGQAMKDREIFTQPPMSAASHKITPVPAAKNEVRR